LTAARRVAELPSRGGWAAGARLDPITGLVAFPDFHAVFGTHLAAALAVGNAVGVAIGDVDDLKGYVECSNTRDPPASVTWRETP
jgi:hypothetical protein